MAYPRGPLSEAEKEYRRRRRQDNKIKRAKSALLESWAASLRCRYGDTLRPSIYANSDWKCVFLWFEVGERPWPPPESRGVRVVVHPVAAEGEDLEFDRLRVVVERPDRSVRFEHTWGIAKKNPVERISQVLEIVHGLKPLPDGATEGSGDPPR